MPENRTRRPGATTSGIVRPAAACCSARVGLALATGARLARAQAALGGRLEGTERQTIGAGAGDAGGLPGNQSDLASNRCLTQRHDHLWAATARASEPADSQPSCRKATCPDGEMISIQGRSWTPYPSATRPLVSAATG